MYGASVLEQPVVIRLRVLISRLALPQRPGTRPECPQPATDAFTRRLRVRGSAADTTDARSRSPSLSSCDWRNAAQPRPHRLPRRRPLGKEQALWPALPTALGSQADRQSTLRGGERPTAARAAAGEGSRLPQTPLRVLAPPSVAPPRSPSFSVCRAAPSSGSGLAATPVHDEDLEYRHPVDGNSPSSPAEGTAR